MEQRPVRSRAVLRLFKVVVPSRWESGWLWELVYQWGRAGLRKLVGEGELVYKWVRVKWVVGP
jgi:hypothetical protein